MKVLGYFTVLRAAAVGLLVFNAACTDNALGPSARPVREAPRFSLDPYRECSTVTYTGTHQADALNQNANGYTTTVNWSSNGTTSTYQVCIIYTLEQQQFYDSSAPCTASNWCEPHCLEEYIYSTVSSSGGGGGGGGGGSGTQPPPIDPPIGIDNGAYELLNPEERRLCWQNPMQCMSVLWDAQAAMSAAAELAQADPTNPGDSDNKYDAIRHAYWNALMVRSIGPEAAERWATAHEYGSTSASTCMDLENNATGRSLATINPSWSDAQLLSQLVAMANANPPQLRIAPC